MLGRRLLGVEGLDDVALDEVGDTVDGDAALEAGGDRLLGRQGKFLTGIGTDRSICVKPHVEHAQFDQPIDPRFANQIVEVRLTDARANARHDPIVHAVADALHRPVAGPWDRA